MASTAAPFLYQTRTIVGLIRTRWQSSTAFQQASRTPYLSSSRKCLSGAINDGESAKLEGVLNVEESIDGNPAKETQVRSTTKPNTEAEQPDFSWQFNPEEAHAPRSGEGGSLRISRTYGPAESSRRNVRVRRLPYAGYVTDKQPEKPADEYNISFEDPKDNELAEIWERDEISELTRPRKRGESTITVAERHAFQKIFADIHARHVRGEVRYKFNHRADLDANPRPSQEAQTLLLNVLDKAQEQAQGTKSEIIQRYPPALRAAAARAIGLDLSSEEKPNDHQEAVDHELLGLQHEERTRVQELMKNATSDFELWDIMEKEVFSLIPKLGLQDPPKAPELKQKKGGKRSKKVVETKDTPEVDTTLALQSENNIKASTEQDGVSPLALYGPLYGEYLLFGLRLFDRAFSKPSPLSLSVLPKIKSLGLVSSVLGGSTMLYNELLLIYQYRQADYIGMLDLLSEMEHLGLDFDEKTYEVVVGVMRTQASVFRGERGETLKALWQLPEFAPQQFGSWREKIRYAINERMSEAGVEMPEIEASEMSVGPEMPTTRAM